MKTILERVKLSQDLLRQSLIEMNSNSGLTKDRYHRFLTMQYHLTKGVQKHFMQIAGNSIFAKKKMLRDWLINFAQEEEFHFEIAKADLKNLGLEPEEMFLDVKLWWLYFDSVIATKPFERLGATCILENISEGSSDMLDNMIKNSNFLNSKNLRFLTIHRHGPNLAHGSQVLDVLSKSDLSGDEMNDLVKGAEIGTILYLRCIGWVIKGTAVK